MRLCLIAYIGLLIVFSGSVAVGYSHVHIPISKDELLIAAINRGDLGEINDLLLHGAHANSRDKKGQTALILAVEASPELVKLLLDAGAKVNTTDREGNTPLMPAVKEYHIDVMTELLKRGASVTIRDRQGRTALMRLAEFHGGWADPDVIDLLLNHGAKIDESDRNGVTTLMLAARLDNTPAINLLLNRGASIDQEDHQGSTALLTALLTQNRYSITILKKRGARIGIAEAAAMDDVQTVRTLLSHGKVSQRHKALAFIAAYQLGHKEIVRTLLDAHCDVNAASFDGKTALMQAVENNDLKMVRLLLSLDASIQARNENGRTALTWAKSADAASLLLAGGADINARDQKDITPIRYVQFSDSAEFMIAHGADINARDNAGETLFTKMVPYVSDANIPDVPRFAARIKHLITLGARINEQNNEGITLLMKESQGYDMLVETLIDSGANVNVYDDFGRTALTWAAQNGKENRCVQLLLKARARIGLMDALLLHDAARARELLAAHADVNVRDRYGETTLMAAAKLDDPSLVEALLKRSMPVNAREDDRGMTALMLAVTGRMAHLSYVFRVEAYPKARFKHTSEIVNLLLTHGANINAVNEHYETVLDIAEEVGDSDVIQLLKKAGAKEASELRNQEKRN